jgi:hypothetical protein
MILDNHPICSSLVFDLLLTSDGRTTDMLESIVGESLNVSVIRQDEYMVGENLQLHRESIICNHSRDFIVSQNYCRIHTSLVPEPLLRTILDKKSGIGYVMESLEVCTFRRIIDSGWKARDKLDHYDSQPIHLQFSPAVTQVPFKQYTIQFSPYEQPGIYMLEYFNPLMLERIREEKEVSMNAI